MVGLDGEGELSGSPGSNDGLEGLVDDASVNALFDASQYAFFGKDVMEEVELGGLEDDDDGDNDGLVRLDEEEYPFYAFGDKEEGEGLGSLSDIDDLAGTFSKLDKVVSESRSTGVIGDRGSFSRENWALEPDFSNWSGQHILDAEHAQDGKRWWSQPHPSAALLAESEPLYRTSSYPQQQHQLHSSSKPLPVPTPSFNSYLPPTRPSHSSSTIGLQMPFSAPNFPPLSGSQLHLAGLPLYPQGLSLQNHSNLLPPRSIGPMPPRLFPQHPHRFPPPQPSLSHFPHMQPQLLGPYSYPPHMMNKFEAMHGSSTQRVRQNGNGWPRFQSKYMSAEEIEGIIRIHRAATHSNDPYADDYYHQACLAKRTTGSRMRHHFCPSSIRDPSSRTRSEPHAFLQVDALGRVPFSSIHRPRPLLEVDPSSDQKPSMRPLEQEPMLAARTAIEDGFCLLLDVDDIDRLFKFSQRQDGGSHLKQRRQVLVEELASLVGVARKDDDLVFLHLVSLPKGRKLISRYLGLLFPGSDLSRAVCMAIFSHLRVLFGQLPTDLGATETAANLAGAVSACVRGMDLSTLTACLAAIACSQEQPPLRPIGSAAGDEASVIVKSVLERATELFTNQNSASSYSTANRAQWQSSFDAFFGLLMRYCLVKYENIAQSLQTRDSDADKAISGEMPIELLRASLPHTDERQRKLLLDFAQRSMPVHGNGNVPRNS